MDARTVDLIWGIVGEEASLTFVTDFGKSSFSAPLTETKNLPSLPDAIAADEPVAAIADAYQVLLRSFQCSGADFPRRNAMERLSEHFGYPSAGNVNIRLAAKDGPAASLLRLPWELLLHDNDLTHLRDRLARVGMVRTLGETSQYSPQEIDGQFRVLLLQGARGYPALDFEGERNALQAAWVALGKLLRGRIAQPAVYPAEAESLVRHLVREKPHLLWFSGHGRQNQHGDDFELLFAHELGGEWRSVSVLSDALVQAKSQTQQIPFVVAFWACDSSRSRTVSSHPSLDSGSGTFPILVREILSTGAEAVLGAQSRVYDRTARIMGESFFRAIAQGSGPAAALAIARADLHRRPSPDAPGSGSEWTSPVLWTNGADMPQIKWASSIGENEALVFHRFGRESMLAFEGGRDIFSEQPDLSSPPRAQAWVQSAPIWVTSRDLSSTEQKLEIIRDLRQVLLTESKTVLVIQYDISGDNSILDAVARAFHSLKRRMFPSSGDGAVDFLVSLFPAFASGKGRDAWLRLLQQPELVIAILAEGGMYIDENLAAAHSVPAKVIVFSNRDATGAGGKTPDLTGWKADDLGMENSPFNVDESVSAFLAALATLDKPLAKESILFFGRDFGLDEVDSIVAKFMARFGDRYVVKASIARRLVEELAEDGSRAAHRACMNFLKRVPGVLDVDYPTQLAYRSAHALKAGEEKVALDLAESAINALLDQGNYAHVVEIHKSLGRIRTDLRSETKVSVAKAQIEMGQAQRAYDLIRQTPIEGIHSRSERIRYRVMEADALRNLPDRTKHEKSIEVLEQALGEFSGDATSPAEIRWLLIAKHDLGRNIHYFRKDAAAARDIFEEVSTRCGEDPVFAYTKAAALRNLSDIYGEYGYGQVPPDPHKAEGYLRQATDIASKPTTLAKPLLAELLYLMAKVDRGNSRVGDAWRNIRDAIDSSRKLGIGRILALSTNKHFWWDMGPLTPENSQRSFDYSRWLRIEEQLNFASQDPWVARALVSSRVRAARSLDLQSKRFDATEVLVRARALLEENTLFAGVGDFYERWQAVFAGLAVLNGPAGATGGHDENTWAELRTIGQRIVGADVRLANPEQIWREVA